MLNGLLLFPLLLPSLLPLPLALPSLLLPAVLPLPSLLPLLEGLPQILVAVPGMRGCVVSSTRVPTYVPRVSDLLTFLRIEIPVSPDPMLLPVTVSHVLELYLRVSTDRSQMCYHCHFRCRLENHPQPHSTICQSQECFWGLKTPKTPKRDTAAFSERETYTIITVACAVAIYSSSQYFDYLNLEGVALRVPNDESLMLKGRAGRGGESLLPST